MIAPKPCPFLQGKYRKLWWNGDGRPCPQRAMGTLMCTSRSQAWKETAQRIQQFFRFSIRIALERIIYTCIYNYTYNYVYIYIFIYLCHWLKGKSTSTGNHRFSHWNMVLSCTVIHPLNQPIESWNLRFPGYETKKPKAREKVQASEG